MFLSPSYLFVLESIGVVRRFHRDAESVQKETMVRRSWTTELLEYYCTGAIGVQNTHIS